MSPTIVNSGSNFETHAVILVKANFYITRKTPNFLGC